MILYFKQYKVLPMIWRKFSEFNESGKLPKKISVSIRQACYYQTETYVPSQGEIHLYKGIPLYCNHN